EQLWRDPIDHNLFGCLNEFGDAELSILCPGLIVEASRHPEWRMGPQAERNGGKAAPGAIVTPDIEQVKSEVARVAHYSSAVHESPAVELVMSGQGEGAPGSDSALALMFKRAGVGRGLARIGKPPTPLRTVEPLSMDRLFRNFVEQAQRLVREAPGVRAQFW